MTTRMGHLIICLTVHDCFTFLDGTFVFVPENTKRQFKMPLKHRSEKELFYAFFTFFKRFSNLQSPKSK